MESRDNRHPRRRAPQAARAPQREARAIAIALPSGEERQEHQTHEQEGREAARGGPGLFACFEANERRRIRAVSDARLVLILGPWPGEGHPSRER